MIFHTKLFKCGSFNCRYIADKFNNAIDILEYNNTLINIHFALE